MSQFASENLPYGVRSLKQMKQVERPSDRLTRKKAETQRYFIEKVDPVVSACITHMLCFQTDDVPTGMLDYFLAIKENRKPATWTPTESKSKIRKDQRVLFTRQIGPIISKLVNRIALSRPDDVVGYFHSELTSIMNCEQGIFGPEYDPYGLKESKPASNVAETSSSTSSPKPSAVVATAPEEPKIIAKNIQLAFFGANGAGKTSLINALQDIDFDLNMRPTIGFRPISMQLDENTKVKLYDLGGGPKIRDIWGKYYHDVHGFIYAFDGKTLVSGSAEEIEASVNLYMKTISNPFLIGKPALIVINKDDDNNSFDNAIKELEERIAIKDENARIIYNCNKPVDENSPKLDSRFDSGINWLLGNISSNYGIVNQRVKDDSLKVAAEELKKRQEKERTVLKRKIASVFISSISPDKMPEGVEANPEEVFDEKEGLSFIAAEINEEAANLPELARQAAALVGYQRLAMQMLGGMKAPVSKNKVAMTWEEIVAMVKELRSDLGI